MREEAEFTSFYFGLGLEEVGRPGRVPEDESPVLGVSAAHLPRAAARSCPQCGLSRAVSEAPSCSPQAWCFRGTPRSVCVIADLSEDCRHQRDSPLITRGGEKDGASSFRKYWDPNLEL